MTGLYIGLGLTALAASIFASARVIVAFAQATLDRLRPLPDPNAKPKLEDEPTPIQVWMKRNEHHDPAYVGFVEWSYSVIVDGNEEALVQHCGPNLAAQAESKRKARDVLLREGLVEA